MTCVQTAALSAPFFVFFFLARERRLDVWGWDNDWASSVWRVNGTEDTPWGSFITGTHNPPCIANDDKTRTNALISAHTNGTHVDILKYPD